MSKREKASIILVVLAVVLFFTENFYFGWHPKATSSAEAICDSFVWVFLVLAYFVRPVNVKTETTTINTQTVQIAKASLKKATFNKLNK